MNDLLGRGALPAVSVIVPVKNGAPFIGECLACLQAQRYPAERLELIVADDDSTDRTAEICGRAGVTLIRSARPGPSAARNAGARRARGEILLFADADCLAEPDWVARHVAAHLYFRAVNPSVQVIGGSLSGRNRSLWAVCDDLCSWAGQTPAARARPVESYLATANLSVTRPVMAAVGGFDEELRCGEDIAFCAAARRRGYQLHFEPRAQVAHVNRTSLRGFLAHPLGWTRYHPKLLEQELVFSPLLVPLFRKGLRSAFWRALLVCSIFLSGTARVMIHALRGGRLESVPLLPFILANQAVLAAGYSRAISAHRTATQARVTALAPRLTTPERETRTPHT